MRKVKEIIRNLQKTTLAKILPPFLITRLNLLLTAWFSQYFPISVNYPIPEAIQRGWHFISFRYLDIWARWDSGWYLEIINNFYQKPNSWAFFPLFPTLIKSILFFLPASARNQQLILALGLILNILFTLLALVILRQLVTKITKDEKLAQRVIWYMLLFPTGFILSAFYTEALFLFLSVLFFKLLEDNKYWQSAIIGGLASVTRSPGLLLIIPLTHQLWTKIRDKEVALPKATAILLTFSSFIFGWLLLAHLNTDSWLVPFTAQSAWKKRLSWPWQTIFNPFNFVGHVSIVEKYLSLIWISLTLLSFKTLKDKKYAWYALAMLTLPLVSGTLISFSRYLLIIFPIFIVLAKISTKKPWLDQAIRLLLFTIQVLFFTAWCQFYWVV